jgi:hypothetical protein
MVNHKAAPYEGRAITKRPLTDHKAAPGEGDNSGGGCVRNIVNRKRAQHRGAGTPAPLRIVLMIPLRN